MITYRYDAYGNTTKSNNTLNNPYQYNAEYTDSSTELQYLRARYYDSSQGRFTTKDSVYGFVQLPITFNPYTYVCNNPLNLIDPSGRFFKQIFGTVAGGARALWDGVGGLVTGKGTSGFKSGWNKGKADGQRAGAKLDNSISRTVQRNAYYYSDSNSLHINPNSSEIYNGGPYYTNLRDQYYQAQSQRALSRMTALEAKTEIAKEKIRQHYCEKADRIVAQQIAQDNMQMEQHLALKESIYGKDINNILSDKHSPLEEKAINKLYELGDYNKYNWNVTESNGIVTIKIKDSTKTKNTFYYGEREDFEKYKLKNKAKSEFISNSVTGNDITDDFMKSRGKAYKYQNSDPLTNGVRNDVQKFFNEEGYSETYSSSYKSLNDTINIPGSKASAALSIILGTSTAYTYYSSNEEDKKIQGAFSAADARGDDYVYYFKY